MTTGVDVDGGVRGTVVSVNVAAVRHVPYRGGQAPTGIWKAPVAGRVPLREHAFEGDVQADLRVHGGPRKAAYAYAREDVAWWEEQLGRALPPGTFGENLTLEGVDVTGARVGERWRIGTAVVSVTQPRSPCWKLGVKMEDRTFPRRFRAAGRNGAYLAVVDEGDVGAGDRVSVLSRPLHPVTIGVLGWCLEHDPRLGELAMQAAALPVERATWLDLVQRGGVPEDLWTAWAVEAGV